MRPKRYPFSGAKKESEAKKISLMLKKVDELDLKGSVWAEPLPLYSKTRVYVEIEGYGKKIITEFKTDDMDFFRKTSFFKRALFKRAEMMLKYYTFASTQRRNPNGRAVVKIEVDNEG